MDPKWREWIRYFIEATINQANDYIDKLVIMNNRHREIGVHGLSQNIDLRQ